MSKKHRHRQRIQPPASARRVYPPEVDPSTLASLPVTYQELTDFFQRQHEPTPFKLRKEAMLRIEALTKRPLICYASQTHNVAPGTAAHIDDGDIAGFADLINGLEGDSIDVLIVSNGGSAEASERIVRLLRSRFSHVRFVVPGNAYSAATLICLSGDEILMDPLGTLGPIDPQINGVPARAILRAFETLESRLKSEGPRALAAYMPLISKYDLHILEICKSAIDLSRELAIQYLSKFMLKLPTEDPRVLAVVDYFLSYDIHKSHGRSIDRETARAQGIPVRNTETLGEVDKLFRGLANQYLLWFDKTDFYKVFESAHGIAWGRQQRTITVPVSVGGPPPPVRPGPPERSD